jgi:hypothetical protein
MTHFFQMLNTCINDAFGMLFWNILIMKRKGYFFHQIQIFPNVTINSNWRDFPKNHILLFINIFSL